MHNKGVIASPFLKGRGNPDLNYQREISAVFRDWIAASLRSSQLEDFEKKLNWEPHS